ncbi:DUF742 domain-containing protein [Saccharopolyspora erythraea]|uniref:DUF742 domain-containing protein n=1 Tax=Saccharopolyspora erythraea TaxID=1836 RepID=UPI002013B4FD|nr:DUF742 domain-containing protein [Saccharopolyspora erythraea]
MITAGRAHPTGTALDPVTLVVGTGRSLSGATPEQRRVLELCQHGALSVAEVAGHLRLPLSVAKVLLSDLVESGQLAIQAPRPDAQGPDVHLLQEVLDGLRTRL